MSTPRPLLFTVLPVGGSVQAGGHMGSAPDHADIRGFGPHISVGPEPASHQTRASSLVDIDCVGTGHRHGDRVLVYVESDVGELLHGRFPPCVGVAGPTPADDPGYTRIGPVVSW